MPNGKRIPGLKIDNPRQLAVMHALVRFANIAAGSQFQTKALHGHMLGAAGAIEAVITVLALHQRQLPPRPEHHLGPGHGLACSFSRKISSTESSLAGFLPWWR